ncbi:MAG TPA: Ser-Thr-rich GPI-anchored membrane family protein, partial [Candidatus Paceibacterota bacterium]|nr:Ser-Thr-rich GPI-anchored membrane family protein [Candidatus Paceibacterota bacterium]
MKKIFLVIVAFFLMFAFSPIARAQGNAEDLSLLQRILEQAKVLQQKLIEREAALSIYQMKVISPNGGETIRAGQYTDIKWDATNAGVSKIDIYLTTSADEGNRKDPGFTIAKDVPLETPFYHWLVPNNLAGQGYKIFIRNNGKSYRLGDYSDAVFNISAPEAGVSSVKLNSPKGGEMYIAGRTYSIHWNMPKGSDRYVSIKLIKGDQDSSDINYVSAGLEEYIPASQGSTEWLVPDFVTSGDYKMKIIGLSNLSCNVTESSNIYTSGVFKIVKDT